MGVVNQERNPVPMTNVSKSANVQHAAQIVGRGNIYRQRRRILISEHTLQSGGGEGTGTQRAFPLREKPMWLQIQKGTGMEEGLMGVAASQHRSGSGRYPVEHGQIEHGFHTLGGAAGTVEGVACAKEGGGIVLAFQNDALWVREIVGTLYLCDVQRLTAQGPSSLMTRHMKPGIAGISVAPDKVTDGGIHACRSWLWATCNMIAHSIRFLKSSQP